jgi:hypothetical protein
MTRAEHSAPMGWASMCCWAACLTHPVWHVRNIYCWHSYEKRQQPQQQRAQLQQHLSAAQQQAPGAGSSQHLPPAAQAPAVSFQPQLGGWMGRCCSHKRLQEMYLPGEGWAQCHVQHASCCQFCLCGRTKLTLAARLRPYHYLVAVQQLQPGILGCTCCTNLVRHAAGAAALVRDGPVAHSSCPLA